MRSRSGVRLLGGKKRGEQRLSILRLSFEASSQNLNRLTGVTVVYNTLEWQGWSKVETLKCKRVVLSSRLG